MREVELSSGGRRLAAAVSEPEPAARARPGLLFVHGWGSSQAGYRRRAAAATEALDAVSLTFDLTGHGRSALGSKPVRVRDHLDDVLAALDHLGAHPRVDPLRLGVCGASYGGYLAARSVSQRPVRRLLLRAPGLYDDEALEDVAGTRPSRADAHAPELFTGLLRSGAEVLILESGADEVIPHSVIEAYLAGCPSVSHEVLPEATHALTRASWEEAFVETVLRWFSAL